jgi:MFS transporter, SP family, galactose:H+ symporter
MSLLGRQQLWTLGMSLLVGLGGVLYGYDIGVISGALLFINKTIPLTDFQTGCIVSAVLAGGLLGTLVAGPLADRYGRRSMIFFACVIFIIGVGLILLASGFITLLLARLFLGVGVGVVAVAVPLYVSELVPAHRRGIYVTFFQLFLTFGILLANGVDLFFTASGDWRAMFAVVLIPAVILMLGVLRLPESPRWLVANGYKELARKVLRRTHSIDLADKALIRITESMQQDQGRWSDLFSSKLLLPLFIAISVAILNQLTGINTFLQYAPSLLKMAGVSSNASAMVGSFGIASVNFVCTIIALFFVDRVGRRPLLLVGVGGVFLAEAALGVVNLLPLTAQWCGVLSLLCFLMFIMFFAIGPGVVVWLAISELFPTRVRGKGIALCLFFNSLAGTVLAMFFLNIRNELHLYGAYWLCAFFSLIYLVLTFFLLPETKGKSLEQIQEYFMNRRHLSAMNKAVE